MAFRSTKGSVGTSPSIVFLCKDTGPVEGFFGDAPGKSVKENESGVGASFRDVSFGDCFVGSRAGGVSSTFALIVSCSPSKLTSSLLKGNEFSCSSRRRGLGG